MAPSIPSLNRKPNHISVVVSLLFLMIQTGSAFEFKVGGPTSSWTVPSDPNTAIYNHWAEKTRFQIGDSLLFVYDASQDSVLHVTKDDYTNCNTASPLEKLSDGHSLFHLNQSGPYYFISGEPEHCRKNEKLVVVVMADRSKHKSDSAMSSPPPEEETPSPPLDSSPNTAAFTTAGALAALLGFSVVLAI